MLPLSNAGTTIKADPMHIFPHFCTLKEHRPCAVPNPVPAKSGIQIRASFCFENCSFMHACRQTFVNSHAKQFNFHKQLGSAAITWKFIFPGVHTSPTLGEDGIRPWRILSFFNRMHFVNSVLPSKESTSIWIRSQSQMYTIVLNEHSIQVISPYLLKAIKTVL